MSWDIFSKSKIQYFLQKLKDKFVQKETGKGLSTNDYTTTDKNKVSKIDTTTTSISGNPISISGLKANQLAVNPIITFEPIQAGSGTPSPSNIRAISGYDKIEVLSCGKNLFDKSKATLNKLMTPTGEVNSNDNYHSALIAIKGDTDYYLTNTYGAASSYSSIHYDKNLNVLGSKNVSGSGIASGKITSFADSAFMIVNGGTATIDSMQIEESPSATTYVPYHKTTDLSESLGQTVYGGSLDVRTGKARIYLKALDMSTMDWQYSSGLQIFYCYVSDIAQSNPMWCSCYNSSVQPIAENYTITSRYGYYVENPAIVLKDTRYTDATSLKTALTGQTVVYTVTTPTEIQLTPHEVSLLKDYAYVSTNGTSIALDYHNGELASLSDVSQLGETVNELGEYTHNKIFVLEQKAVYYTIGSGETISVKITSNCIISSSSYNAYYFQYVFLNGWITVPQTPIANHNSSWSVTGGVTNEIITIKNNTNLERGIFVIALQ